ncbi:MAG: putative lipopolysaccharide heptosyltransferase III [Nevskia sp.]
MSEVGTPARVLVMELGGLGDNIHLLPALRALRRRWPQAELQVMVHAHVAGLFELVPWVQKVWGYPASPKPKLAGNWRWGRALRAQRYDLVLNTTGGDRASLLTWLTRAPERIARRPSDGGPRGWSLLFTRVLDVPYWIEPMFVQKLRCARLLGCDIDDAELAAPQFEIALDTGLRRQAGVAPEDDGGYIHISPFTTSPARELPLAQIAALIAGLRAAHPALRVALSCAGSARETQRLAELLVLLPAPPWRVWPGTLPVPALASVIAGAALNFSGDTGGLHVALMTGTPAVAWFRAHRGEREWIPRAPRYRVLVAEGPADAPALAGIDTAALLDAAAAVLAADRDTVRA